MKRTPTPMGELRTHSVRMYVPFVRGPGACLVSMGIGIHTGTLVGMWIFNAYRPECGSAGSLVSRVRSSFVLQHPCFMYAGAQLSQHTAPSPPGRERPSLAPAARLTYLFHCRWNHIATTWWQHQQRKVTSLSSKLCDGTSRHTR